MISGNIENMTDGENSSKSFQMKPGGISKALTFSEHKFNIEPKRNETKKSLETHEIVNNDSMMNIHPFVPSEINSKNSYENYKSHSSCSKEGHEIVFHMKESLKDLDALDFSPEKTPIMM